MTNQFKGFLLAIGAYLIWGLFPLYFHFLNKVSSYQIVLHRLIWSFIFAVIISCLLFQRDFLKNIIKAKHFYFLLLISAILIGFHWLSYNWAISNNMVVDASLGYFLLPLISTFLGWFFLKEKPNKYQKIAIILGIIAVAWLVFKLNKLPWISLLIAFSFSLYGFVKKQISVDSLTALVIETGFLFPFGVSYWIWLDWHQQSAFNINDYSTAILLIVCGILTALPLFLFASATKQLTLTAIGFMMYITPSMQFLTAVFVLKEPLNFTKLIAFIIIWISLIVFSLGAIKENSVSKKQT